MTQLSARKALKGTLLLVLLIGLTFPGFAQEDARFGPDIIPAGQAVGTQRVYVVDEGDTMWDVADRFLGDPWMWPLLWSFNPQVTNPHWIFPGDMVFLDPPKLEIKRERLTLEGSRYATGPLNVKLNAQRVAFLPEARFRTAGVIRGSREERDMIARWDEAYVHFSLPKRIHSGERYTIVRQDPDRAIRHPHTGKLLGYLVQVLGEAKVIGTEAAYSRVLVDKANEEIVRGDLILLRKELKIVREPTPNSVNLDGTILEVVTNVNMAARHDYVLVDQGIRNGVQVGNRFVILKRGDGYIKVPADLLPRYPYEIIGEIMVVYVYDDHSVGVITRATTELEEGVLIRMIQGY